MCRRNYIIERCEKREAGIKRYEFFLVILLGHTIEGAEEKGEIYAPRSATTSLKKFETP